VWGRASRTRVGRRSPGQFIRGSAAEQAEFHPAWTGLPYGFGTTKCITVFTPVRQGRGRRKFVRPLFAALMEQGEWGRAHAIRIYRIARPGYHSVTSGSVDAIVK